MRSDAYECARENFLTKLHIPQPNPATAANTTREEWAGVELQVVQFRHIWQPVESNGKSVRCKVLARSVNTSRVPGGRCFS